MKTRYLSFVKRLLLPVQEINQLTYFKVGVGTLVLIALMSYHPYDPSPFNLFTPAHGIQNSLLLPGALLAGFLLEGLGWSAYSLPILLLLLGRKDRVSGLLRFLPILLEILSVTTLIALCLQRNQSELLIYTGYWGVNAKAVLSEFPGVVPCITLLVLYQLLFLREHKIDSTLLLISTYTILLLWSIVKKIKSSANLAFQNLLKYSNINWMTPGFSFIEKGLESLKTKAEDGTVFLKRQFTEMDFTKHFSPFSQKNKSSLKQTPQKRQKPDPLMYLDEEEILSLTVAEYEKSFYLSDCSAFLVFEEEI